MKFSKTIIVTLLILIVIFVSVMTITYWIMGDVPEPLITAVAAMVTAEGGFLMLIKNVDTKHKRSEFDNQMLKFDNNESEDDENDGYNTDTDGDNDADNVGDNSVPDTLPERKNRRKEVCRAVKVGVGSRNRR